MAIAEPGHACDPSRLVIPSPTVYPYDITASGMVCLSLLKELGIIGKIIHVSESLGYNIAYCDLLQAALHGTLPLIQRHILDETSTKQMGFELAFACQPRQILGGRSIAEALLETSPSWWINPIDAIKFAHGYLGWNAPEGVHKVCMH